MGLLGEIEARFGLEVHCYVLMSNHYHLLLRMRRESGLSAGMQWLGVSYAGWFNRRHRRKGHLFEGRFKAILVEFESWGAALSRYIHLNPVRIRRYGLDKKSRAAERVGLKPAGDAGGSQWATEGAQGLPLEFLPEPSTGRNPAVASYRGSLITFWPWYARTERIPSLC